MQRKKLFFNYQLLVWMLLIIALIMGGGYLVIAYSYNLQKDTEQRIDAAQQMVNVAREMEIELVRLRGFTLIYLVDKSRQWQDSIKSRQTKFIIYLERARLSATTPEETRAIQEISALFSNYELTLKSAKRLVSQGRYSRANTLIVHAAKDLLDTIHEKSRQFIYLNRRAEDLYELDLSQANAIIRQAMFWLGLGGILSGLLLGWIISRMVFNPINQLILQVRSASGGAFLEKLEIPEHGDLEELGERIKALIDRINQAQEALDKTKQLLQYSNKYAALGKVAPIVAHEIRNPLAAIKMLVYSMKEEISFPEKFQPDLEIISSEINRMDDFIRNFLKFARPPDPIFTTLDPVIVLQEVVNLLKPKFKSNMIQLIDNTFESSAMVLADSGHMKQLFMNLLINAIEAMPDGGNLSLSTSLQSVPNSANEEPNTQYLTIIIEDSGHGIPEKVLANMFEPFIKGSDHGVGIGLSISQNIANIHNGWIEARNKQDVSGAIFTIYLPVSNPS
jgi:two-component system, NtrC family, sensor histidine kinase HydH